MPNNSKHKVFITRKIPEAGISLLSDFFEVDVWEKTYHHPSRAVITFSELVMQ